MKEKQCIVKLGVKHFDYIGKQALWSYRELGHKIATRKEGVMKINLSGGRRKKNADFGCLCPKLVLFFTTVIPAKNVRGQFAAFLAFTATDQRYTSLFSLFETLQFWFL